MANSKRPSKTPKVSREECASQLAENWRELQEIVEKLKTVEEQFKRGSVAGPHADATFTMATTLGELDDSWGDGKLVIKKMRTVVRNRLKAKVESV